MVNSKFCTAEENSNKHNNIAIEIIQIKWQSEKRKKKKKEEEKKEKNSTGEEWEISNHPTCM